MNISTRSIFLLITGMMLAVSLSAQTRVLNFLSTFDAGGFDEGAAEIVAFDPGSKTLFFVNGETGTLDLLDLTNPAAPSLIKQVDITTYGEGINSVDVYNGIVAAAIEGPDQMPGKVVVFNDTGAYVADYPAGTLPDMVTFSPDGNYILVANEGEPSDDYMTDPEGSVTVVDISAGADMGTVTQISLAAYNSRKATLQNAGVRIFGPNATVAQDLEPEYITVDPIADSIAYVVCQENNALIVVDFKNGDVLDILALGYKNHMLGAPSLEEYFLDTLSNLPVLGTPVYGGGQPPVNLGGFSGLYFDEAASTATNYVFYAIPDRGPNDGAVNRNSVTPAAMGNLRPFKLPNYQARIVKFSLDVGSGAVSLDPSEQIFLTAQDSVTPITGRGNAPGLDETPVTYPSADTLLFVDFENGSLSPMTGISVLSNEDWRHDNFGGDNFAEVNGFGADTTSNDWLISPALDLTTSTNPVFSFFSAKNFSGDGLSVLVSTDYDGTSMRPDTFTWTDLTPLFTLSPGGYTDTASGSVNLGGFVSSATYLAFQYLTTGTGPGGGSVYQIDDIFVGDGAFPNTDFVDNNGTPFHLLEYDAFGGDFEGILRDGDGNFWMCDEYRPAIYKFSPEGYLLNRFIAAGTKARVRTSEIFFSEYAEGSSNNKYLEIYNGTADTIDFDDYMLVSCGNACAIPGEFEFDNTSLWAGKKLAPQEVFVIAHPSAQGDILAEADTTIPFLSNGDDWWGILRAADSSIVDQVGDILTSGVGDGWDVAGVFEGTKDHTLIRKHYILSGNDNWAEAAGLDSVGSEWLVKARPTASFVQPTLGSHLDLGEETLPAVYGKRRANRGFEALALDTDSAILYAFIQSPLDNPSSAIRHSDVIRILGINPATGQPVKEYVYFLESNRYSNINASRVDKIGDAVYVGDGKFWILERDSSTPGQDGGKKFVFEFTLEGATNILGLPIASQDTGMTLESMTADEIVALGIQPVYKTKVLNLPTLGYFPSDKPEGLAALPDGKIAVLNDNDFGLAGAGVSDRSSLGIISFDNANSFDASNRDDAINIINHPTLGMFQPDAIKAAAIGGKSYIFTANEGDARDYDGYSEEERVGDLTLDANFFANPSMLQADSVLGRLNSTTANGDIDGDGEHEIIYSYGARSFSVWDNFGNLVYDSGNDFETLIAMEYPDHFNSTNDDNDSFDNRSDDKGPEPEAIEIADLDTAVYAFIGLERMGGIMVYRVDDPSSPEFVEYELFRDFSFDADTTAAGDLGPEDIRFIKASDSPNGKALVVVANEVSGSITLYQLFEEPTVSIDDQIAVKPLRVYPNPNSGNELFVTERGNYTVFNLMGQQMTSVRNSKRIDISELVPGMYIVRNDRNQAGRFLKK